MKTFFQHSQRRTVTGSPAHRPDGYAMLMSLNKGETAVHGCHCPGDTVVRVRKVMAIPRRWYVCFSADIGIVQLYAVLPVIIN